MEFSRPEYCSGLPFPFPGDLPSPGIKPRSPACWWILYCLSHQGSSCLLSGSVLSYSSKTLWTVARQTLLSIGLLRQGYWCGVPFLFQGIFLTQGLNLHLLCLLYCRQILYLLSHWELSNTGNLTITQDCYLTYSSYANIPECPIKCSL